ncbi:OmpW family protein [Massilia sp. TS11]|uniref:OmpW/AlkL family protein n=1 Tax=Massilia sp. TS11 TaxID=2908003 RepID=UPI001ED9E948|nr:OmpW family outer membrane protein [Massilia sp. TS11]MCG2586771.1 outer membrane beta-barrel protein [Massilia sp. TS11]
MKRLALAAAVLALFAQSAAAADATPFQVRLRAVHLDPADKSDPVGGTGKADRISVSSKTIPDIDFSYYFTPNIAAELVLTVPQKHDVALDGGKIGSFKHLPPTLTLQYHFAPNTGFDPYVGAGLNYTLIHGVDLLGGKGGLEHNSVGLALQAGADFNIDSKWSINVDIKKIQIRSDVFLSGAKISNVKVDPLLVGVGVGYRF